MKYTDKIVAKLGTIYSFPLVNEITTVNMNQGRLVLQGNLKVF